MHYPAMNDRRHYRAAVIGAGFGGVAAGAALGQAGIDYVILEHAASIGGSWRFRRLLGRFDLRPYHQLERLP